MGESATIGGVWGLSRLAYRTWSSGGRPTLLLEAVGSLVAHLVAGEADNQRKRSVGPLHGLPMGVNCFSLGLSTIAPVALVLVVHLIEVLVRLAGTGAETVP